MNNAFHTGWLAGSKEISMKSTTHIQAAKEAESWVDNFYDHGNFFTIFGDFFLQQ